MSSAVCATSKTSISFDLQYLEKVLYLAILAFSNIAEEGFSFQIKYLCSRFKDFAVNFTNSVMTFNNNEEFVNKLETLKNNYNISYKLRKNSKKLIKNFSQEKINQSYLKIIKI